MKNSAWVIQVFQCPEPDCGSFTALSEMDQDGDIRCGDCGILYGLTKSSEDDDDSDPE